MRSRAQDSLWTGTTRSGAKTSTLQWRYVNCIAQGIGTEGVSAMDELWNLEKSFWTGGAETYEARLCLGALMILPPPAGVLDRAATIDAIRAAERWARVTFSQKHVLRPVDPVAILAYVALADRDRPGWTYSAQCSSVYVLAGRSWRLAAHQQTPLTAAADGRD